LYIFGALAKTDIKLLIFFRCEICTLLHSDFYDARIIILCNGSWSFIIGVKFFNLCLINLNIWKPFPKSFLWCIFWKNYTLPEESLEFL